MRSMAWIGIVTTAFLSLAPVALAGHAEHAEYGRVSEGPVAVPTVQTPECVWPACQFGGFSWQPPSPPRVSDRSFTFPSNSDDQVVRVSLREPIGTFEPVRQVWAIVSIDSPWGPERYLCKATTCSYDVIGGYAVTVSVDPGDYTIPEYASTIAAGAFPASGTIDVTFS